MNNLVIDKAIILYARNGQGILLYNQVSLLLLIPPVQRIAEVIEQERKT